MGYPLVRRRRIVQDAMLVASSRHAFALRDGAQEGRFLARVV